jgi:hypothetical protein
VPSGGRHENCWGISCEKSLFYAKKITFFPIAEGGAKSFGVFRVKNHDFMPKKIIFSPILGVRPPLDPPLYNKTNILLSQKAKTKNVKITFCSAFQISF